MANEKKVYLPKQPNVRRGVAGYKNLQPNHVVVDGQGRTTETGGEGKKKRK